MTKEQICMLDTAQLRAILRSTNPNSERFALQISWAREEMDRRYKARNDRLHGITLSELAETSLPWGVNRSPVGPRG